jgi:hemoglobin
VKPGDARADIATREDIAALVSDFYRRLLADASIAPVFADIRLEAHLAVIANFWVMILLGEDVYRGNTFQKHVHLPIEDRHFGIWLAHWTATIDDRFAGERADLAKARAQSLAAIFQSKFRALGRTQALDR